MQNNFIFRFFLAAFFVLFLNVTVFAFSPFDLLRGDEEEETKEKKEDLSEILDSEFLFPSESNGQFKKSASVIILDKRTGKPSPIILLEKGKSIDHGGMLITLESCWQEEEDKLYKDARALISVSHNRDVNLSLWISSKFPGLSSVNHPRFEVLLQSCDDKVASN